MAKPARINVPTLTFAAIGSLENLATILEGRGTCRRRQD